MNDNEGSGTYSVLIGLGAIVCIGMIIFNSCSGRSREVQPTSQVDTILVTHTQSLLWCQVNL